MSESCNGRERCNLGCTARAQMGEMLYAVKVSPVCSCLSPPFPRYYTVGSSMLITLPHPLGVLEVSQEQIWKRIHQEAYGRILHLHIASCRRHWYCWSCPGWEQGVVRGGPIGGDQERGHVTEWSRVLFQANIDGSVVFAWSRCHTGISSSWTYSLAQCRVISRFAFFPLLSPMISWMIDWWLMFGPSIMAFWQCTVSCHNLCS